MEFLISGLLDWTGWQIALWALVVTHITIVCVTIFLHRAQAHRALELSPVLAHGFRFWLWLTTGMVTKEWVAIHRKHHARCETTDDPHSPVTRGIRTVLLTGSELYREAARSMRTTLVPYQGGLISELEKYGRQTPDDWIERHLYSRFTWLGVGIMLIADILLFGVVGLVVWAIQMLWIPVNAAGIINGLGHWWGYRNFDSPDASTNIVPWGIVIGGEELHNNHHTYPTSAKFSVKPWELDVGWGYICILSVLRLLTVKHLPPRAAFDVSKEACDGTTVEAIVGLRYEVLSWFDRVAKNHCLDGVNWQGMRHRLIRLWKEETVESGQTKTYRNKEALVMELHLWLADAERSASAGLQALARRLTRLTVAR